MDGSRVMVAFNGDAAVKEKYLARLAAHRKADEIVQGYYWQAGKGCAVGCTVHSSRHEAFEEELGIPRVIARIEDQIFERLDNATAKEWPEQFLRAPAVGADLSMVWPRFALWLLSEQDGPVALAAAKRADVKETVAAVAALYREWIETGVKPESKRWRASAADAADAASAADAAAAAYAAAYATDAAAYATYAAAAYAAAYATDAAAYAAYAAYAADAADAAAAARSKFWLTARDKLLELLRDAPVLSAGCAT